MAGHRVASPYELVVELAESHTMTPPNEGSTPNFHHSTGHIPHLADPGSKEHTPSQEDGDSSRPVHAGSSTDSCRVRERLASPSHSQGHDDTPHHTLR